MLENNQVLWLSRLLNWRLQNGLNCSLKNTAINRYVARDNNQVVINDQPVGHQPEPKIIKETPLLKDCNIAVTVKNPASIEESLQQLKNKILSVPCPSLKLTAHNLVFADGNPHGKIMLIGEAPGAEEDQQGLPFVGQSGKLLDKILATINLNREKIYITNIVPWRPSGNRAPTTAEIADFYPLLQQHIQIIAPKILVLVGGVSAKTLLNSTDGIVKLRGKWFEYRLPNGTVIPTLPIFHPAYLLRSPGQKAFVWRDMLTLYTKMQNL